MHSSLITEAFAAQMFSFFFCSISFFLANRCVGTERIGRFWIAAVQGQKMELEKKVVDNFLWEFGAPRVREKKFRTMALKHFFVLKYFYMRNRSSVSYFNYSVFHSSRFPSFPRCFLSSRIVFFPCRVPVISFIFFPFHFLLFVWETECFFPTPPPPHPRWYGRKSNIL